MDRSERQCHWYLRFNTTKVRLFPGRSGLVRIRSSVSIPQRCDYFGIRRDISVTTLTGFNTTKVRLFPLPRACTSYPCRLFQYHKGAIISRVPVPDRPALRPFQYHKGAIISPSTKRARSGRASVSIPQRCDYFPPPQGTKSAILRGF